MPRTGKQSQSLERRNFRASQSKMAGARDWFIIGSMLACKTYHGQKIEGEVQAFDPQTKMLVLKCPASNGKSSLNDVHILNLSFMSNVQVIRKINPTTIKPLQNLNLESLNTRVHNQLEEKKRLIDLQITGRKLFITISKIIQDITWNGANIVVFGNVIIRPPYNADNVHGNTESRAYRYIKKVVEKHIEDTAQSQQEWE